jgi:hypothetical protein
MAVAAVARTGAPIRQTARAGETAAAQQDAQAAPAPDADGVVRSDAAKAGYKAWLKGRMKSMFEDIIATATKRRS